MSRDIKDATVMLITGAKCFGMALRFTQYEWDRHLDSSKVAHRIKWPDGEVKKVLPEAE